MPVVAAVVCPHPPLLVPEVCGDVDADVLDVLRAACVEAVSGLAASEPDALVVVGATSEAGRTYDGTARGTFAAYGAARVEVGLGAGEQGRTDDGLPLSLLIGSWILGRSRLGTIARSAVTVASDATPEECLRVGADLAVRPERVALLVMADGSARRSEHAPAHLDPRGEAYDQVMAEALATADVETLAHLDPEAADTVAAGGRPAWQVLAGAARMVEGAWRADVTYDAAPYGVGYFVASWARA